MTSFPAGVASIPPLGEGIPRLAHNRERLVLIWPGRSGLVLHTLYYHA